MRMSRLGIALTAVAMAAGLALAPAGRAQQTKSGPVPAAPIPEQLATATSVFIANAGVDSISWAAFQRAGDPYQAYNLFYGAVKKWGRYQLVTAPAHADLIFEVRFTAPLSDCGRTVSYSPQMQLTILDAKTHFILWAIAEPVEGAFLKSTWDRNVNEGVTNIVGDLQRLVAQPVSTTASSGD
jgi:hypothetical protein